MARRSRRRDAAEWRHESKFAISTASVSARSASATEYERRWLILAVLSVAQLMVVLDATVVNIALPSAQQALHSPTAAASGW